MFQVSEIETHIYIIKKVSNFSLKKLKPET
jgi:hypothetical protein